MYKNTSRASGNFDLASTIDGYDFYNSSFLMELDNLELTETKVISRFADREDLIAESIYNSASYSGILPYINRRTSSELSEGDEIEYPTLEQIKEIR